MCWVSMASQSQQTPPGFHGKPILDEAVLPASWAGPNEPQSLGTAPKGAEPADAWEGFRKEPQTHEARGRPRRAQPSLAERWQEGTTRPDPVKQGGHRASSQVLGVVGGDLDVFGCFLPDTPGLGTRLFSLGGALHMRHAFAFQRADEHVDALL